jgi:hypothetical protein
MRIHFSLCFIDLSFWHRTGVDHITTAFVSFKINQSEWWKTSFMQVLSPSDDSGLTHSIPSISPGSIVDKLHKAWLSTEKSQFSLVIRPGYDQVGHSITFIGLQPISANITFRQHGRWQTIPGNDSESHRPSNNLTPNLLQVHSGRILFGEKQTLCREVWSVSFGITISRSAFHPPPIYPVYMSK